MKMLFAVLCVFFMMVGCATVDEDGNPYPELPGPDFNKMQQRSMGFDWRTW